MGKTRIVHPGNLQAFMEVYGPALLYAVQTDPDEYAFPEADVPKVVDRMRQAFERGSYNHDGRAIKAACRALGIKHTRKAIEAFITL